jgi:hypothetical protein
MPSDVRTTQKINAIRKSYAKRFVLEGHRLKKAAARAKALEERMFRRCAALAGEDFLQTYDVSFQPHGDGMAEQFDSLGEVLGPGFADVECMGRKMLKIAKEVLMMD